MMRATGNPAAMVSVIELSITLFNQRSIGRDTHMKFMDDARSWSTFDPDAQRKLNSPEVEKVRRAAERLFTEDIAKGGRYEVEGLARFIGDCANRFSDDAALRAYCDRAEKYLVTITPSDGPFGRLLIAVRANTNLVNWSMKNDTAVRAKMLRIARIEEDWGMAVRYRLRQLEKERR